MPERLPRAAVHVAGAGPERGRSWAEWADGMVDGWWFCENEITKNPGRLMEYPHIPS